MVRRLEDDGKAELRRDREGLVARGGGAGLRHRDAGRGEERSGSRIPRSGRVEAPDRNDVRRRSLALRLLGEQVEGRDRRLDIGVDGHAPAAQLGGGRRIRVSGVNDECAVPLTRRSGERASRFDLLVCELRRVDPVAAEVAREEYGVDVRARKQQAAGVGIGDEAALTPSGEVDGVGDAGRVREVLAQGGRRRLGEPGHLEPGRGQHVAGDDAVASAVGVSAPKRSQEKAVGQPRVPMPRPIRWLCLSLWLSISTSACAASTSCLGVSTRTMPPARQAASIARGSLTSAPVWEKAARPPARLTPPLRRSTRVPRSTAPLAASTNARPSRKSSR